jgi:hypothetical protein
MMKGTARYHGVLILLVLTLMGGGIPSAGAPRAVR